MSEEHETLGSYLRSERKKKDISLEQVAYATRISVKMLRALEEDRHDQLPAQPFVRGYLQAYAKYVKLDAKDVLLRYQHHLAMAPPEESVGEEKAAAVFSSETRKDKQRMVFAVVAFLLLLAGSGAFLWLKEKLQEEEAKKVVRTPVLRNSSLTKAIKAVIKPDSNKGTAEEPAEKPIASKEGEKSDVNAGAEEKRKAEAQAKREAEEKRKAEEQAKRDAEEKRKAEEQAKRDAEEKRKAEEQAKRDAEEKRKAEEQAQRKQEEESQSSDSEPMILDPQDPGRKHALSLKAKEDVWIRFQTDEEEIKDLILREGRTLIIRADQRIKLFSGNLDGLEAEFNGNEIEKMTFGNRKRSVVLPMSEVPKVPLPLFPENVSASNSSGN